MKLSPLNSGQKYYKLGLSASCQLPFSGRSLPLAIALLLIAAIEPAMAHHALGGETPHNFWEGLLSGLAHPVIGLDHFAFVLAVGLLAALKKKGAMLIPVAFVLATLGGTATHLVSIDLPFPEIVISASVVAFGIMLGIKESPPLFWLVASAALAGLFHGYAYGESIVGAEIKPLVAYLAGFAIIQLAIASMAFAVGKLTLKKAVDQPSLALRFAGFTICGAGVAFLTSTILT